MPALPNEDAAVMAMAEVPGEPYKGHMDESKSSSTTTTPPVEVESYISEDDLKNLRRVSGKIPWVAFTIAFVELCERFSYYGTTVVFVNFLQQPLPEGSPSGAGFGKQSGALGMGQRASTGLTTFNQV
jgi:POT family proton-dependent oligopeptide transporter